MTRIQRTSSDAWSLQRRIVLTLMAYIALLSAAITVYGYVINERAESLMWKSLLTMELDHLLERRKTDPAFGDSMSAPLELFSSRTGLPDALKHLGPGVHDDIVVNDRERVVLVRNVGDEGLVLALDIDPVEQKEKTLGGTLFVATLGVIGVLSLLAIWGVNRLVGPFRALAARIGALSPQHVEERVPSPSGASKEVMIIVDAMNDFLRRNEEFVERERAFIDTASHELRTPVSVISGAAQNALSDAMLTGTTRHQLERIRATTNDIEALIVVLLILAKDPDRLAALGERVALAEVLETIVDDHRPLCAGKALDIRFGELHPCEIVAPPHIVRSAIGNLLRNAIENSDRGEIIVSLKEGALVEIIDPGHGMTPAEISAIFVSIARGRERGGGIGLPLIGRLCQHLGWSLDIASGVGQGSRIALRLASLPTTKDAA
jgi:signal transduction histidine kinase